MLYEVITIPDFSGTSAAAPHAAGAAALLLEARPAATPEQLRDALRATALDMGAAGFDNDSGYGLIRADQTVTALTTAGVAPAAAFTWNSTGLTVQFTDQSSDEDGTVVSWSWTFGDGNGAGSANPAHIV